MRKRPPRAETPGQALRIAGVFPSRQRGQNFLAAPQVAERIVALAELQPGDEVIEIGPGLGILSQRILARQFAHLRLFELDPRLARRLRATLSDPRAEVVQGDFLAVDLALLAPHRPLKVLGNLPFNVAARIFRQLSDHTQTIARMVLMFQREVGERIRARPGEDAYGALSVLAALDWTIEQHFRVQAGSFHPVPKVDAEVLCFVPRAGFRAPELRAPLKAVIRAAFASRRKILRNTLASSLGLEHAGVELALAQAHIPATQRAERLSLEDFVRLTEAMLKTVPMFTFCQSEANQPDDFTSDA